MENLTTTSDFSKDSEVMNWFLVESVIFESDSKDFSKDSSDFWIRLLVHFSKIQKNRFLVVKSQKLLSTA